MAYNFKLIHSINSVITFHYIKITSDYNICAPLCQPHGDRINGSLCVIENESIYFNIEVIASHESTTVSKQF